MAKWRRRSKPCGVNKAETTKESSWFDDLTEYKRLCLVEKKRAGPILAYNVGVKSITFRIFAQVNETEEIMAKSAKLFQQQWWHYRCAAVFVRCADMSGCAVPPATVGSWGPAAAINPFTLTRCGSASLLKVKHNTWVCRVKLTRTSILEPDLQLIMAPAITLIAICLRAKYLGERSMCRKPIGKAQQAQVVVVP